MIAEAYEELRLRHKQYKDSLARTLFDGDISSMIGKKVYTLLSSPKHPSEECEEWTITRYGVLLKDRNKWGRQIGYDIPSGKRITKKLLEEAQSYIREYEKIPLDEFYITFGIERVDNNCKTSTGIRFRDGQFETLNGTPVSFSQDVFQDLIAEHKRLYEEKYAPREGCVPCERCGKQVPLSDVVRYKLVYRAWDFERQRGYVTDRIGVFCSGECAMNEQMSLEG